MIESAKMKKSHIVLISVLAFFLLVCGCGLLGSLVSPDDNKSGNILDFPSSDVSTSQEVVVPSSSSSAPEPPKPSLTQVGSPLPLPTQAPVVPSEPYPYKLKATCKDGSESLSAINARDYTGMCSGHGGIGTKHGKVTA